MLKAINQLVRASGSGASDAGSERELEDEDRRGMGAEEWRPTGPGGPGPGPRAPRTRAARCSPGNTRRPTRPSGACALPRAFQEEGREACAARPAARTQRALCAYASAITA